MVISESRLSSITMIAMMSSLSDVGGKIIVETIQIA